MFSLLRLSSLFSFGALFIQLIAPCFLFAALSTTPHLPTEAYASAREEDAQGIAKRKTQDTDEDCSSDSDEEDKDSQRKKKKRRPVSDESSAKSSFSQTSRSVLSDSSRSHLQARRASDSQELTTMPPGTRYQEKKRKRDESQSSRGRGSGGYKRGNYSNYGRQYNGQQQGFQQYGGGQTGNWSPAYILQNLFNSMLQQPDAGESQEQCADTFSLTK